LGASGDVEGEISIYREALRLDPKHASIHNNLGNALLARNNLNGAVASYREATRLAPANARAHNNLGNALRLKKDLAGAIASGREAVRLDPKVAAAHNNLGNALRDANKPAEAVVHYREAVRLDPRYVTAHANLGLAVQLLGDLDGAVGSFREAVRLDPTYAPGHAALAWVYAAGPDRLRNGPLAVEHAQRACEDMRQTSPQFLAVLAAAYAEAGAFDNAVEYQKKALADPEFDSSRGPAARERLRLYERKLPYRDPALAAKELAPPPRKVQ
jgi:Flp pilus assembly protein TadD